MAGLEYDLIDDLIVFPRLKKHELVLAQLHVVPGVREEVVHQRSVWLVHVQAHYSSESICTRERRSREKVVCSLSEYREARPGLEGPECAHDFRIGKELLQEALRFVCGTEIGGGDGTRSSTCL